MWQKWINLVLGLWIILSANLGLSASQMITNLTISGIIISALAVWSILEITAAHRIGRHGHAS